MPEFGEDEESSAEASKADVHVTSAPPTQPVSSPGAGPGIAGNAEMVRPNSAKISEGMVTTTA